MAKFGQSLIHFLFIFFSVCSFGQNASFTAPDTVCVSQPVNIVNTSSASSYYWNFCVSNLAETIPVGVNLGNIDNQFSGPVFMDYAFHNGSYYGFLVNHNPSALLRLDFGNSLLNTPTVTNFGNLGGVMQTVSWAEGIQVIQNEGKWYAIIVGGWDQTGSTPSILKVEFGANFSNPAPIATEWGNIGNELNQPVDLHLFQDGANWYGFTVNAENNTITRFNFGSSFDNPPTAENLGNVGGLFAYPDGVFAIEDDGEWRVFVVNGGDRSQSSGVFSITRLDFGSSLLNMPTAVNLGNPGNFLQHPRDITLLRSCGQTIGFAINGHLNNNSITRYDFSDNLSGSPMASNLGNIGNLSFPHSISKLFREGSDLYAFITNASNHTLTRLQFSGCTNSSIPSSTSTTPPPIIYNAPGVYNINLTVDDGLATQASFCRQVVVVPEPVHTPVKTIAIRAGESIKIGTGNVSGSYKWNTTNANTDSITVSQEGLYYVETSGYGCSNIDSFRIIFNNADFSFQQDPCDPLTIVFKNETPGVTVVDWDFGNGLHAPGDNNPTISYTDFNTYNVTLTIDNGSGNNISVTKSVAVLVQTDSLIVTRDTTICAGTSIELNALAALSYCWTPSETLSASDIANPVASPVVATTYYLNSLTTGKNLIINGDFSSGNTGFTSQYNHATPNITEGQYFIGTAPNSWNPNFQNACTGRGGSGNIMMVNGNPVANAEVWKQTITVTPNTNYAFSTWIQSLFNDNPAQLMFSINGVTIGNTITATVPVCNWTQFFTTWNSGNNTSAIISIVNKNTLVWGNDFALDDISFAPVLMKRDSVRISIEKPVITARADTALCEGVSLQMDVTGDAASYQWTPADGLSQTNGANPLATPNTTTAYVVTGKTLHGCEAKDTVNVIVHPLPDIKSISDTTICGPGNVRLNTTGSAASYSWSPGGDLSDPSVASPMASVASSAQYIVTGESGLGCIAYDTVNVKVVDALVLQVRNDTLICEGSNAQLQSVSNATLYSWTPSTGLTNSSISNPIASPLNTTQYILTATTKDGCSGKDTVSIAVNAAPVITLTNDTLICPNTSVQLTATGGISYQWNSSSTLSNPNISNPIATPQSFTTYLVKVTDGNNCTSTSAVDVDVRDYPVLTAWGDASICEGEATKLFATGGHQYQWNPGTALNDPQSAQPVASPLSTTQYSVYIKENICNIDTTIDVRIDVNPIPDVNVLKSNDINCVVRTAQLFATGASSYTWSPGANLDNANRPDPVAGIDTTTLFTVKGTTEYGCSSIDSILVKVTAEGNPLFVLPNVFTPNGDRINDCFGLTKWGRIQLQEFSVYNRWGEKVFSTNNSNACWDGTYKGILQASGTFVYVVKAKTFCGRIDRKGLVTLIR